jgi:hypothetical protein
MVPQLMLGTCKTDITPEFPLPLAGFATRRGVFESIAHRLYARIFAFEQKTDAAEVPARALIVSADLIWWGTERMDALRKALGERYGIGADAIILQGTHTHSGPQTSTQHAPTLGECDRNYVERLENLLLAGVGQALQSLEPVTIETGKGQCGISIHRRKRIDGRITMAPNEDGPIDRDVTVIRYRRTDGSDKALMVHYACHPTTTDSNAVSSEYCGVAMEEVERQLGGNVISAFMQGCCGDIRPALIRDGNFFKGTDTDVCALGEKLSVEVMAVLNRKMTVLQPAALKSHRIVLPLSLQSLPTLEELRQKQHMEGTIGAWSRMLLADPGRIQPAINFEMTLLRIAGDLSFLAMNGEVVAEYGLIIKETYGGRILPVPYSNGMQGYIPTSRQVEEGGYEGRDSFAAFGLPAPFAPSLEPRLRHAAIRLADEVL